MIITISYYPLPHTITVFFLMRTLKIYFLSNFQICHTVLSTTVTVLYVTSLTPEVFEHLHPCSLPSLPPPMTLFSVPA